MGRIVARDCLYKLVFESLFVEPKDSVSFENLLENEDLDEESKGFVRESYVEILKEKDNILEIITKSLNKEYDLQRMFKADLSILVLSTYEMMYKQTDAKIVINEAVKLAKKYSTDKSYSFVNGVLGNIVKDNNLIYG